MVAADKFSAAGAPPRRVREEGKRSEANPFGNPGDAFISQKTF